MKSLAILIAVEDDSIRKNLEEVLIRHQVMIVEALDKMCALQSFRSKKPDLIIVGFF
jgi:PleD family two-component response regulator